MNQNVKKSALIFVAFFCAAILIFVASVVKTNIFNRKTHHEPFSGASLFSEAAAPEKPVSVNAVPRSSTWTKVFDLKNEGLSEPN